MGKLQDERPVISLQDILTGYVWNRYLHFLGKPKKYFVKKQKFHVDINWDFFQFEHNTTADFQFDAEEDVLDSISFGTSTLSTSRRSKQSESYVSADSDVGAPYVLCTAKFENHRSKRRRFRLFAEKETPVSVSIRFKEYFLVDKQSNLQVDLPTNIIPGDRSEHSFLVTQASHQTFHNTYKWTVNSGVIVKGSHKVRASCIVHEQEKTADIEVKTVLSSTKHCFPVVIRRKSDDKIVYTCLITDLADVFRSHASPNLALLETVDDENRKSTFIILTSRGTCKATGWTDQQVIVSSQSIMEFTV